MLQSSFVILYFLVTRYSFTCWNSVTPTAAVWRVRWRIFMSLIFGLQLAFLREKDYDKELAFREDNVQQRSGYFCGLVAACCVISAQPWFRSVFKLNRKQLKAPLAADWACLIWFKNSPIFSACFKKMHLSIHLFSLTAYPPIRAMGGKEGGHYITILKVI